MSYIADKIVFIFFKTSSGFFIQFETAVWSMHNLLLSCAT